MSADDVRDILIKAVTDTEFRETLFNDPDEAVADYDLSEEELDALKQLEPDKFTAAAGELEERISRAGISPELISPEWLRASGVPPDPWYPGGDIGRSR